MFNVGDEVYVDNTGQSGWEDPIDTITSCVPYNANGIHTVLYTLENLKRNVFSTYNQDKHRIRRAKYNNNTINIVDTPYFAEDQLKQYVPPPPEPLEVKRSMFSRVFGRRTGGKKKSLRRKKGRRNTYQRRRKSYRKKFT